MKTYQLDEELQSIISQKTGLDCFIEDDVLSIYSRVYWYGEDREDYNKQKNIIDQYKIDNLVFDLDCVYDISDFDYWQTEAEGNYLTIRIVIKTLTPIETQIIDIINSIIECEDYMLTNLKQSPLY